MIMQTASQLDRTGMDLPSPGNLSKPPRRSRANNGVGAVLKIPNFEAEHAAQASARRQAGDTQTIEHC